MTVDVPEEEGEGAGVMIELTRDRDDGAGVIDMMDTSDDNELTTAEELDTAWGLLIDGKALLLTRIEAEELLTATCVEDIINDEERLGESD